jgi:hypothetical protein
MTVQTTQEGKTNPMLIVAVHVVLPKADFFFFSLSSSSWLLGLNGPGGSAQLDAPTSPKHRSETSIFPSSASILFSCFSDLILTYAFQTQK